MECKHKQIVLTIQSLACSHNLHQRQRISRWQLVWPIGASVICFTAQLDLPTQVPSCSDTLPSWKNLSCCTPYRVLLQPAILVVSFLFFSFLFFWGSILWYSQNDHRPRKTVAKFGYIPHMNVTPKKLIKIFWKSGEFELFYVYEKSLVYQSKSYFSWPGAWEDGIFLFLCSHMFSMGSSWCSSSSQCVPQGCSQ